MKSPTTKPPAACTQRTPPKNFLRVQLLINLLWWSKGCFYITPFITFWCKFGWVWCASLSKSDTGLTHRWLLKHFPRKWLWSSRALGAISESNQYWDVSWSFAWKARRDVQGYLQMSRGRETEWMNWVEQWAKIKCSRSNALAVLSVTTVSALHIPGINMCHQSTNNKSCKVLQ